MRQFDFDFLLFTFSIRFLVVFAIHLLSILGLVFNCSWTKFMEIMVNVLVFFVQIFRLTIFRFSSRTFFEFSRAQSVVQMVTKREVTVSNPGGVECFCTRLSLHPGSNVIRRFMFCLPNKILWIVSGFFTVCFFNSSCLFLSRSFDHAPRK